MNKIPYYWADMSLVIGILFTIIASISIMIFDQEAVLIIYSLAVFFIILAIIFRITIHKKLKKMYILQ